MLRRVGVPKQRRIFSLTASVMLILSSLFISISVQMPNATAIVTHNIGNVDIEGLTAWGRTLMSLDWKGTHQAVEDPAMGGLGFIGLVIDHDNYDHTPGSENIADSFDSWPYINDDDFQEITTQDWLINDDTQKSFGTFQNKGILTGYPDDILINQTAWTVLNKDWVIIRWALYNMKSVDITNLRIGLEVPLSFTGKYGVGGDGGDDIDGFDAANDTYWAQDDDGTTIGFASAITTEPITHYYSEDGSAFASFDDFKVAYEDETWLYQRITASNQAVGSTPGNRISTVGWDGITIDAGSVDTFTLVIASNDSFEGMNAAMQDAQYYYNNVASGFYITEFNDEDSGSGNQYIEVYNNGRSATDMYAAGYRLSMDGGSTFFTGDNWDKNPLPTYGYGIFTIDPTENIPSEGGTLGLYRDLGGPVILIEEVSYGQQGTAPDPLNGQSVARLYDAALADYSHYWTRNASTGPTWGAINDVSAANSDPQVVLNQVFFNPIITGDKFVELYLINDGLDISGYKIVGDTEYIIPEGVGWTTDDPFYYLTYSMDNAFFDSLNPSGDNIYLYDDTGSLLDMVGWSSAHVQNESMCRIPEGNGTRDGYDDASSTAAGWVFGCTPTTHLIKVSTWRVLKIGNFNGTAYFNLTVSNSQPVDDTILIFNSTLNGYPVTILDETGSFIITKIFVPAGTSVNVMVKIILPSSIPYIDWDNITITVQSENSTMIVDAILLHVILPEIIAEAGPDQAADEGEILLFNGNGYYDPCFHKLVVNFATDSALYLRISDPVGPGAGAWEGGVREWVTFTSDYPFWIAKRAGHMGQGPTDYDYTYYWKMHETGDFTLHFRAGNGYFNASVYDETIGAYVIPLLFVDHGSVEVIAHLDAGHIYRVYIYNTFSDNPSFPNDLDVVFKLTETDILLTPDRDSLVYYVTQNPLVLDFEGPGVGEITFYSRGIQEFYTHYLSQLNHSEVEITGGELSLAPPPYNFGITPGEYDDNPVPVTLNYTWDFDSNYDSDGDGNPTNDSDAFGPTPAHTYGDDGDYTVILTVRDIHGLTDSDICNVTVSNLAPTIEPFGPFTIEVGTILGFDANASDPGSDDLSFTWNWGDGTSDTISVHYNDGIGPDPYPSPWGTFPFFVTDSLLHVYDNEGVYTVNLTVEDDDGGITFYSTTVTVISIAPPELYIDISPDGDDVVLNWDPPGLLGVDHYLIYRSTTQIEFDFNNPWKNTSADQEPGEPSPIPLRTMWNDTGAALPGDFNYQEQYYYTIRAVSIFGRISKNSRTVGKWTRTFSQGKSSFSLPLEPLEPVWTEDLLTDMNAEYIRWMHPGTHSWMKHGDGCVNDTQMELGSGYEIRFNNQTNYTFTGMPAAMIRYNDAVIGFDAAPGSEAGSLTAAVNLTSGTVTLQWLQPAGMGTGDGYHVLRSTERDGFWGIQDVDYVRLATLPFDTLIYEDIGNATTGTEYYYMIMPVNLSTGNRGASSYSIGIWTEEYLPQYDTFGIPLKLSNYQTADWYCDNIPDTVGINYFNISWQRWSWHSERMPAGAFDPVLVMSEGYQISTSNTTKFTFIGI